MERFRGQPSPPPHTHSPLGAFQDFILYYDTKEYLFILIYHEEKTRLEVVRRNFSAQNSWCEINIFFLFRNLLVEKSKNKKKNN